ncbi:MAG: DegV family protein [Lysobacterales bacterium]
MTQADQSLAVDQVDGAWMRCALIAGIHRLISRRDHINRINVFPVADSDTGTNLALTMHAVLTGATREVQHHLGRFLEQVADQALDGARGNSGAIFAQYWQGFAEAMSGVEQADMPAYAAAARQAASSAQVAIGEPREGTMLTVLTQHAHALEQAVAQSVSSFPDLLHSALSAAQRALAKTPEQLDVLAAAGVVDAGAQGFVDFLEGMQDFAETGEITSVLPVGLKLDEGEVPESLPATDVTHRYCTECMLTADALDKRRLREALAELPASSMVLAGTRSKMRIHIHTNDPKQVFAVAERFGDVSREKVDDMQTQSHSVRSGNKVAIVADTGADIPDELLEKYSLHLVPLRVTIDDHQYIDKVSFSAEDFYQRLTQSENHPTTSQPPPSDYRRQFEFLDSHFKQTLCISLSGAVSGTWQAADGAAKRVSAERITVWDSRQVSASQGLLAVFAARCADEGYGAAHIVQMLGFMQERSRSYALLQDLSFGVRGGRLPAMIKTLADWLRLTPLIATQPEGTVGLAGVIFSRRHALDGFARWMSRRLKPNKRYDLIVADCAATEAAETLATQLKSRLTDSTVWRVPAGAALGAHAGPGCLIVGVQEHFTPEQVAAELNIPAVGNQEAS